MSNLELKRPHVRLKESYLSAMTEMSDRSDQSAWMYLGEQEPLDTPQKNFEAFVSRLLAMEHTPPQPNFVCSSVYWGVIDNEVVGRISLRHSLNEFLLNIGGHIGYIVRPSYRGKGIATQMLAKVLQTEKAKSIGRLLLTCDPANLSSEKTILKNGGVFENIFSEPNHRLTKRFWIDVR